MDNEIYDILVAPDPILKTVSTEIGQVDDEIRRQMDIMLNTMYDDNGIGLAANQVGKLNRVLVMDVPEGVWKYDGTDKHGVLKIAASHDKSGSEPKSQVIQMANPEIIWQSEERSVYDEGCLSLPGHYAVVERPAKVRIKFLNRQGKAEEKEFAGLDSHCVQHEIDHLDGLIFVDHISRLKKDRIMRKLVKAKKGQNLL